MKIHQFDENSSLLWNFITMVKMYQFNKSFLTAVMKLHQCTVIKIQHWDANWRIWWKIIYMTKSHDCVYINHWDNNSSLWLKVIKGIKINPPICREQIDVMKVYRCDENQSNSMKIHQSNVNSMIWWKCIYKMRIHDSDKKSTNFMEIQLCDKTYQFDKHLSLRWKFISPMKMYQSDEIYHIDDLRSLCWPIKNFYWEWL